MPWPTHGPNKRKADALRADLSRTDIYGAAREGVKAELRKLGVLDSEMPPDPVSQDRVVVRHAAPPRPIMPVARPVVATLPFLAGPIRCINVLQNEAAVLRLRLSPDAFQYIGTQGLGTCVGLALFRGGCGAVAHFDSGADNTAVAMFTQMCRALDPGPTHMWLVQPRIDNILEYRCQRLEYSSAGDDSNVRRMDRIIASSSADIIVNALMNAALLVPSICQGGGMRFVSGQQMVLSISTGTLHDHPPHAFVGFPEFIPPTEPHDLQKWRADSGVSKIFVLRRLGG